MESVVSYERIPQAYVHYIDDTSYILICYNQRDLLCIIFPVITPDEYYLFMCNKFILRSLMFDCRCYNCVLIMNIIPERAHA